jgi:hypothetical protein
MVARKSANRGRLDETGDLVCGGAVIAGQGVHQRFDLKAECEKQHIKSQ